MAEQVGTAAGGPVSGTSAGAVLTRGGARSPGAGRRSGDARPGRDQPEDEATTLWARQDLFTSADIEIEDEDELFDGPRNPADGPPRSVASPPSRGRARPSAVIGVVQTGPISLAELARIEEGDTAPDTVMMSADEAAAARNAADLGYQLAGGRDAASARAAALETQIAERSAAIPGQSSPGSGSSSLGAGPRNRVVAGRGERAGNSEDGQAAGPGCRMCGKEVLAPTPRRLRGPADSSAGFVCDTCENVFCAAHTLRVSGLFESLFKTGRFRCQLCQLEASRR